MPDSEKTPLLRRSRSHLKTILIMVAALSLTALSALLLAGSTTAVPAQPRTRSHNHSPSEPLRRALESRQSGGTYQQFSGDITQCQGYALSGMQETSGGMLANLTMQGSGCNAFGNDIKDLTLLVEYQTQERLHVHIYDTAQQNWQIPEEYWARPSNENAQSSDLKFNCDSSPFAFWVTRRSSGEVLFDTRSANIPTYSTPISQNGNVINGTETPAHPLVFSDQYLQLSSALPVGANVYGLGEVSASSGIRRNTSSSLSIMFPADNGIPDNENLYGIHNFYFEKRASGTHGVFLLNSHGTDVLLRDGLIEYRLIGGTLDMYFVSGPTEIKTIEQYGQVVGFPQQQQDWAFGLNVCRWGFHNISEARDVVTKMREADIPTETMWSDIDWMKAYRNYEFDDNYAEPEFRAYVDELHANHQHYVPIIDAAYAVTMNDTDVYDTFTRGDELGVWMLNPDGSQYRGRVWPGVTVFWDPFANNSQLFWTEGLQNFSQKIPFDGLWLDMNEPSSFVQGSAGSSAAELANVSTPFKLPETEGNDITTYPFPECYTGDLSGNMTQNGMNTCVNATELAAVKMTNDFQSHLPLSKRDSLGLDPIDPTQASYPPYDIHAVLGPLDTHIVSMNATSTNGLQHYHYANMYGYLQELAVNNALQTINPNKRPFIISRSTFAGAGRVTGHWTGDNNSKWVDLLRSIQQVVEFSFFGIPFVGSDTGGFNGNTDEELANRWFSLSAFVPFYRTHNTKGALAQFPYVWDSVAEATRTAIRARYSLLPQWESLFIDANKYGTPVLRPLFFAFDDPSYYGNSNQFMIGDSLLVTPVVEPNATSVVGALPTMGNTKWRNLFTHELVDQSSDIVRLDAPLSTIPVHIRSGAALLMHRDPAYTIYETKQGPYSLLLNLDSNGYATGCTKIDDGESVPSTGTKSLTFTAQDNTLSATSMALDGDYTVPQQLAEIVILGVAQEPKSIMANGMQASNVTYDASLQRVTVGGLTVDLNNNFDVSWTF